MEFDSFLTTVQTEILNPIITLIALAAFIVFVWGVVQFIRNAESDEKRKEGQQHMLWGLVGLAIIFGVHGIIAFLKSVTGIS